MRKIALSVVILLSVFLFLFNFQFSNQLPLPMPVVDVDHGGNAAFEIPLEIPEGTLDLTPELKLNYNSGSPNGLLGKGWSLAGIPFIKRDPSYGLNYSSKDEFYSSELGQLVSGSADRSTFYSKNESFFSFYPQGESGKGPLEFKAFDKEGVQYTYGGSGAQLFALNGGVRTWGISEIRDLNGETVRFEWISRKGQLYPDKITYAGGVRYIKFAYETRSDYTKEYTEKDLTEEDWRLKRIKFYSDNSHVHSYEFTYDVDAKTKESLLVKIEFEKDNLLSLATHRPLEFEYAPSHDGIDKKLISGSSQTLNLGFSAKADVENRTLQFAKQVIYAYLSMKASQPPKSQVKITKLFNKIRPPFLNKMPGGTGDSFNFDALKVDVNEYYPETEFIARVPLGNKNRPACDLGFISCIWSTLYPKTNPWVDAFCLDYAFFSHEYCLHGSPMPNKVTLPTDIDGDGISEYTRILGRADLNQAYLKTNDFKNNSTSASPIFPMKYNTYFDLADIDGDGRTDFLFEEDGVLYVSYSDGVSLGNPTRYSNVYLEPYSQNMTQTNNLKPRDYAVDINRDGRADFIHLDTNTVYVYLSQGRSFAPVKQFSLGGVTSILHETIETNPFIAHRLNQFSDIDGDGMPEHVQIVNVNPPPEQGSLIAMRMRHKDEVNQAEARNNHYKQLIVNMVNQGADVVRFYPEYQDAAASIIIIHFGIIFDIEGAFANVIHPNGRALYYDLLSRPGTATTSELNTLKEFIDQQYFEVVLSDLMGRQNNEVDHLISYLRNIDLSGASYSFFVTKFDLKSNTLSQKSYPLPKNIIGAIGKNWIVDVNRDGLPDLLTLTNQNSHTNPFDYGTQNVYELSSYVNVLFNYGDGFDVSDPKSTYINTVIKPDKFLEHQDPNSSKYFSFDMVDVNEDSNLDIVIKEFDTQNFHIYQGNGNGNFTYQSAFSLPSSQIHSSSFEDRNYDGIADMYFQYGLELTTQQIVSNSPAATGGILVRLTNNIDGAESKIQYDWKKNFSGAVAKTGANYSTSLPNFSPDLLVRSVTSQLALGYPLEKQEYSYFNTRFKPGDLETNTDLSFEMIHESSYINGVLDTVETTKYSHNPDLTGMVVYQATADRNGNLLSEEENNYTIIQPHSKTRLVLLNSKINKTYWNSMLKDEVTASYGYSSEYSYEPVSITENWNGRTKQTNITYQSNAAMNIKAQMVEKVITISGQLAEHSKWTYSGKDVISESKLTGNSQWYSKYFVYDSLGNVLSATDSLGRTIHYTYNDITRSKATSTTNALGQKSEVEYDPRTDQVLSKKDHNGNLIEYSYDEYGRKKKSVINGEHLESIEYSLEGSNAIVKNISHAPEGDIWVKTTTNLKGKQTKKESSADNNQLLVEELVFDEKGREIERSKPYFQGFDSGKSYIFYYDTTEDSEERPKKVISATGEVTEINYELHSTSMVTKNGSEVIKTEEIVNDAWDRVIRRVTQGETLKYEFDYADRLTKITDPGNGITNISYDIAGKKKSYSDSNSGETRYFYNIAGELTEQIDQRGVSIKYEYDGLGRMTKQLPANEKTIAFEFDIANSISGSNVIGNLSRVSDQSGITEYKYDHKGNVIAERRSIDDISIIFERTYDDFDRIKSVKYPDGTVIKNYYNLIGQKSLVTIDSHDGSSLNHTVVSYEGPKIQDNLIQMERKTGNGVTTQIHYDQNRNRIQSYVTRLKDQTVEQSVKLAYDVRGNIQSITDLLNESRNQVFEYDHLNRIIKANGKYGEEVYTYAKNGNLLKKGAFQYSYSNPNHIHATTSVNSPNTGTMNYVYDSVGNMTSRNGDQILYNALGKIASIDTENGDRFDYDYEYSGNRIKKSLKNAGTTTYNFNNLYEIVRTPGQGDKHTLYIYSHDNDLVSQYTRTDAILSQSVSSVNSLWNQTLCTLTDVGCGQSLGSLATYVLKEMGERTNVYSEGYLLSGHRMLPWVIVFFLLVYLVHKGREKGLEPNTTQVVPGFGYSPFFVSIFGNTRSLFLRYVSGGMLLIFSFTTTAGCFPLLFEGAESESGVPIWILGAASVPVDTPSVGGPINLGGNNGGSSSPESSRVSGMFFFHPDHLGSITMITDGHGNALAGGERGGKSHISYKPYGEILRTDSYGPDIVKFKYTGQEEDKESGLSYYKARYYDPMVGRFLSNDGMTFPNKPNGMNRQMYVDGNPLSKTDYTGNEVDDGTFLESQVFVWYVFERYFKNKMGSFATPGHNYSGNGNKDAFSDFFNKDKSKVVSALVSFFIGFLAYSEATKSGLSQEELWSRTLFFAFIVAPLVRTIPKSPMDKVSQTHDDSASTSLLEFQGPGDDRRHSRGANEFVKDSFKAFSRPSKLNASDVLTFAIGVPLYSFYGNLRGMGYDLSRANKWKIGDAAAFVGKTGCFGPMGVGCAFVADKNFKTAFFVRSGRYKANWLKIKHTYF
ncbi:RHS repeat-associated core domain-containing protein [Leptospira brenneri]|uniref:RHS repeat-associated core domain-containing protein n=1 Tax=Leptospira brenneri TaxID=2023182 RepID=UPI0013FD3CCF|nr:RHS repeat-associated core domain-containing protein [Leptospira brenneri]